MNTTTQTLEKRNIATFPQWLTVLLCGMSGIFAGINGNLFSLLLPDIVNDLAGSLSPSVMGQLGSYALASFLSGWMLGGLFLGALSDRIGRVKSMAISICIYSLAAGLISLSTTFWQLILLRFLCGVGVGGTMLTIAIFLSESRGASSRAKSIAILVTSYQVGVLLTGLIAGLFSTWRWSFAISFAASLLALLVYYGFQEPIRSKQEQKEKRGFTKDISWKHLTFGTALFGCLLIGYWASLSWIPAWIKTLIGDNSTGNEKNIATTLHGVCAVIGCLLAGPLVDRIGCRWIILTAFLGAFGSSWILFLGNDHFSPMIYAENGMLGFFIGLLQATLYIYLPGLFPVHIRGTAVAICLNGGRVITVFSVFVVGILVSLLGGYAEALCDFALFYLIGAALVLFAPEVHS